MTSMCIEMYSWDNEIHLATTKNGIRSINIIHKYHFQSTAGLFALSHLLLAGAIFMYFMN